MQAPMNRCLQENRESHPDTVLKREDQTMNTFLDFFLWFLLVAALLALVVFIRLSVREIKDSATKNTQNKPKIDVDKPLR
jgi:hypothetical protein